jgi:hypothetical protein
MAWALVRAWPAAQALAAEPPGIYLGWFDNEAMPRLQGLAGAPDGSPWLRLGRERALAAAPPIISTLVPSVDAESQLSSNVCPADAYRSA